MRHVLSCVTAIIFLLLLISGSVWSQERAKVSVMCKKTDVKFAYDCHIKLKEAQSGKPIEGAKFVVSADMPSMPMAHNVKPVTAVAGEQPGTYRVRIQLEMHGEWALKLDLKEPFRDRLIHKMHFGGKGDGHHKAGHQKD